MDSVRCHCGLVRFEQTPPSYLLETEVVLGGDAAEKGRHLKGYIGSRLPDFEGLGMEKLQLAPLGYSYSRWCGWDWRGFSSYVVLSLHSYFPSSLHGKTRPVWEKFARLNFPPPHKGMCWSTWGRFLLSSREDCALIVVTYLSRHVKGGGVCTWHVCVPFVLCAISLHNSYGRDVDLYGWVSIHECAHRCFMLSFCVHVCGAHRKRVPNLVNWCATSLGSDLHLSRVRPKSRPNLVRTRPRFGPHSPILTHSPFVLSLLSGLEASPSTMPNRLSQHLFLEDAQSNPKPWPQISLPMISVWAQVSHRNCYSGELGLTHNCSLWIRPRDSCLSQTLEN